MSHEWYHDIYNAQSTIPFYGIHDRAPVIRRAPITVLVSQPSPPPPPPPPQEQQKLDPDREITRLESTTSSEDSSTPSKRRKYTLKKDTERCDPDYKDMRRKNNESVRKTREKKRVEEEKEKHKNEDEKNALREIVKIMMTRETQHLQEISMLRRLEPPSKIIELSGSLNEVQRRLCEEIRKESPSLAEYRLQMLV